MTLKLQLGNVGLPVRSRGFCLVAIVLCVFHFSQWLKNGGNIFELTKKKQTTQQNDKETHLIHKCGDALWHSNE